MKETNWPGTFYSDNPVTQDPRWQRKVISVFYPIPIIENMFDVTYACGHSPLMFRDEPPKLGELCFCGDCYEESKKNDAASWK